MVGTSAKEAAKAASATAADTAAAFKPKRSAPSPPKFPPGLGAVNRLRSTSSAAPAPKTQSPAMNKGPSSTGM